MDRNEEITKKFMAARRSYTACLGDISDLENTKKLYYYDFSLVHPYIFRSTASKDPEYDALGRSIFSILPIYSNIVGFTPVLSTPSLLELLDSLEHRYDRIDRLMSSRGSIREITGKIRNSFERSEELSDQETQAMSQLISSLRVNDKHSSLGKLVELFQEGKLTLLRDHVDPAQIKRFRSSSQTEFENALQRMESDRGRRDSRNYVDRRFHYKVDCWNLVMSLMSRELDGIEIDHVCRDGISKYLVGKGSKNYTRHPHVSLLRLISLLRASEVGDIQREANTFVKLGFRDLDASVHLLNETKIENLTNEENLELNRVWAKFGRPLFYDYSTDNNAVDVKTAMQRIRDMENGKYKSITTEEGLAEMFKADAEDIKKTVHTVLEISPDIVSTRILEDYELEDDPRIDQIRRRFNL